MNKVKTAWFCSQCGYESPKWIGNCPSCREWNSFVEEPVIKKQKDQTGSHDPAKPVKITGLAAEETVRTDLRSQELNRVLGGGLVPGSLVLIGGEPGIGKSTLALQLALRLKGKKVLYVSGEESARQIKLRGDRIGVKNEDCYILCETVLQDILAQVKVMEPDFVVIDSIQTITTATVESSPGSVSQVRESTAELLRFAKNTHIPFIIIGHINKEGSIAGPKVLEHMVDTVLQFEGDQNHVYRILRSIKNRFGSTSEIGIFEMQQTGLREVNNPSELLLTHRNEPVSGITVAATIEGNRPILIEVQSLVSSAVYGTPQRSGIGFDVRRLNMLLAVLEKRVGFRLANKDVFLNLAGGVRVNDPALDLAVTAAIISSDLNLAIGSDTCFAGEIGLSGEIRPVSRIDQRISEAEKLGFKKMILSSYHRKNIDLTQFNIEIIAESRIEKLFRLLFTSAG
jgi:DNA repair protein RadA/Sms